MVDKTRSRRLKKSSYIYTLLRMKRREEEGGSRPRRQITEDKKVNRAKGKKTWRSIDRP
jgi:hypothetical protein